MHLFIREPKIAETLEKKRRFQPLKTYPAEANMLDFPGLPSHRSGATHHHTARQCTGIGGKHVRGRYSWFYMGVSKKHQNGW